LAELRVYTLNDMVHGMDRLVPGVRITRIAEAEGVGGVGLYSMPPDTQRSSNTRLEIVSLFQYKTNLKGGMISNSGLYPYVKQKASCYEEPKKFQHCTFWLLVTSNKIKCSAA